MTTPATTTTEYVLPADIADVYGMLGGLLSDLTDLMTEDVKEWRSELRSACRDWKGGGDEPDWQNFRDWMNDICDDDGMPHLFGDEPAISPPAAPDEHLEAAYEDRTCVGCCDD